MLGASLTASRWPRWSMMHSAVFVPPPSIPRKSASSLMAVLDATPLERQPCAADLGMQSLDDGPIAPSVEDLPRVVTSDRDGRGHRGRIELPRVARREHRVARVF